LEYVKTIPNNSIDCLIADPPYGVDFQFNKYDNQLSRKIENDTQEAFDLLNELLLNSKDKMKPNAHIYIFCSWKVYPEFKSIIERYFNIKNLIIWNKKLMGMGDLKYNYADMYEMIIFAGGQREFIKRPANIIECRFDEERLHNTQKPVKLLCELITNSTSEGDMIFDPFLGSGSTAVAAQQSKRNFCGCEIDKQNYQITLKRLHNERI
jgi:site-specific DNA-methyltransferase (adenine-specific)